MNNAYHKETQYLIFDGGLVSHRKTPVIEVYSKSYELLGVIKFFPQWRKFVFESDKCIYDSKCLSDLIMVLDEQQELWKNSLKENK